MTAGTRRPAIRSARSSKFTGGALEPTLDQLMAEPIVQQLMRSDHTDEKTIRLLLQHVLRRLDQDTPR